VYRCSYRSLSELLDLAGLPGLIANSKSTLADGLGLGQRAIFAVVSASSGSCGSIDPGYPVPGKGPGTPADHRYRPGFAGALMLEDPGLSQDAAKAAEVATPLGSHAGAL
jgi:3-hydroxyisobutyrate dehydrogenase